MNEYCTIKGDLPDIADTAVARSRHYTNMLEEERETEIAKPIGGGLLAEKHEHFDT